MKKLILVFLTGLFSNLSFGQKVTTSVNGDTAYINRVIYVTSVDDTEEQILKFDTIMFKVDTMTFKITTIKGPGVNRNQLWYKKQMLNLIYYNNKPNCPYNITKIYFKSFDNMENPSLVVEGGCFTGNTEQTMYFAYIPGADVFIRLGN